MKPARARAPGRALVGRSRASGLLSQALAAAVAGHGCLCLIAGPAGIGKSRLTQEITRAAEADGLPTH